MHFSLFTLVFVQFRFFLFFFFNSTVCAQGRQRFSLYQHPSTSHLNLKLKVSVLRLGGSVSPDSQNKCSSTVTFVEDKLPLADFKNLEKRPQPLIYGPANHMRATSQGY